MYSLHFPCKMDLILLTSFLSSYLCIFIILEPLNLKMLGIRFCNLINSTNHAFALCLTSVLSSASIAVATSSSSSSVSDVTITITSTDDTNAGSNSYSALSARTSQRTLQCCTVALAHTGGLRAIIETGCKSLHVNLHW